MRMLKGIALGAALMYILDPNQGKRRRARIRDATAALGRDVVDGVATGSRDLRDRTRSALGAARGLSEEQAPDSVVEQRVRARLGHYVRNSRLLDVNVQDGAVTLRGPLLATDIDGLLRRLGRVRGVRSLDHELDLQPDVAGDGGGSESRVARVETAEFEPAFEWTPTARMLIGSSASYLLLKGLRRRGWFGLGLSALGMMTLSRALAERLPATWDAGAGRETFAAGGEATVPVPEHQTSPLA